MYTISEIYSPFFPSVISLLKLEYRSGVVIKTSHAHEIASAFFGYKTYAAAKSAKLHEKVGIFNTNLGNTTPEFQFFVQQHPEAAVSRLNKLRPDMQVEQVEEVINRLKTFYELESDLTNGFIARITRQLRSVFDRKNQTFNYSVWTTDEDWKFACEIVISNDYTPHSFCHMPWFEFEILATSKRLPGDDTLHQFNPDIFANIVNYLNPDAMPELFRDLNAR